jgi:cysteine desulfurase family protein (TIGR01976 family)
MTTLTFHISRSIGATLRPGDEVIVSGLDHQANVDPWIAAARDNEAIVRTWEPNLDDCTLNLDALDAVLSDRTRLVAVGWASNAVGTINPIREIAERVHRAGAWLFVDAVHAAPHLALDAVAVDADFVACSVYKFFGPHLGAVYGRREIMQSLPVYKVRPSHDGFETGTANHEGDAGAAAAVGYLADLGARYGGAPPTASRRERLAAAMHAIRTYELELYRYLAARLGELPGVRIFGLTADEDMDRRTPTAAITIDGVTPHAAAEELGRQAIAVWDGDFYATGLIERLGLASTGVLRIGLTHYNTRDEVDRLIDALARIAPARAAVS